MPLKFHQKFQLLAMKIFYIPNLSVTIPTKFSLDQSEKNYITEIQQDVTTKKNYDDLH